jgi:hypothetical protein
LNGKDYDEDACKDWVVSICDEIKTRVKGIFYFPSVSVCVLYLQQLQIHDPIILICCWLVMLMLRTHFHPEECNLPRFKLVCQATLGQMKDQGVRVASRCLWDTSVDNYASVNYKNVKSPILSLSLSLSISVSICLPVC